jgi:hypothetical protein
MEAATSIRLRHYRYMVSLTEANLASPVTITRRGDGVNPAVTWNTYAFVSYGNQAEDGTGEVDLPFVRCTCQVAALADVDGTLTPITVLPGDRITVPSNYAGSGAERGTVSASSPIGGGTPIAWNVETLLSAVVNEPIGGGAPD